MNVLLAVDDSQPSEAALAELVGQPWLAEATVRVLTVATATAGVPVATSPVAGVPPVSVSLWVPELEDQQLQLAARTAQRAADALAPRALRVEARTVAGAVGSEIVREASEWPADLIVMGSRGHGALKRLVLGSVAHHVLNHAPCSIRIVRSSDGT